MDIKVFKDWALRIPSVATMLFGSGKMLRLSNLTVYVLCILGHCGTKGILTAQSSNTLMSIVTDGISEPYLPDIRVIEGMRVGKLVGKESSSSFYSIEMDY